MKRILEFQWDRREYGWTYVLHPNGGWAVVAELLPRRLVYFATIRLGAEVIFQNPNQIVPELTLVDALNSWEMNRGE